MSNRSNGNENNRSNDSKPVEKPKMKPLKMFILAVVAIVGISVLVMAVAVFGYLAMAPKSNVSSGGELITLEDGTVTSKPADTSFLDELFMPPERTNVLIMGVDKSQALADVVIVATFERDTQNIDLVFVPRDTKVVFTTEEVSALNKAGRKAPDSVKLTEVHNYAGTSIAQAFTKQVVERILGIPIDYYVEININAFRQLVDTVGGIEMDLPSAGFHYEDPEQDLYINVPGGHQKLTGEMAEGVVRFRSYARGDLQRIEVQQEFMRQFFKQVLNKKTIMENALGFLNTVIKYVKTDFPITEMTKYIKYIDSLDAEKFSVHTVPGSAEHSKYYELDVAGTKKLVDEVFALSSVSASASASPSPGASSSPGASPSAGASASPGASPSAGASASPGASPSASASASPGASSSPDASSSPGASPSASASPTNTASSKGMKLQVLNGAGIAGIATAYNDKLTDAGYNVVDYGNYTGTWQKYTRIMVKEKGSGEDLKEFFKEAIIEIDNDMPSNVDIIIIIGTGEQK